MTNNMRKKRIVITPAQKLEYAKLMVEEDYSTRQVMKLSGAGPTAVARWKKHYLSEQEGETITGKTAFDADKRRIQMLEKQLKRAHSDIVLLKIASYYYQHKDRSKDVNVRHAMKKIDKENFQSYG